MQWRRIGRASFRQRLLLLALGVGPVLSLYCFVSLGPSLGRLLLGDLPFGVRLPLQILVAVAVYGAALVIGALLHPGLQASEDGSRIRIGRHELPVADLRHAWLGFETQAANRQQLILRLEAGRRRTRLWLRAKERVLLDDDERALLVRVLERSSVAPPASPYDPSGRFARYNFPGSLTKQEAIDLVRRVPAPGDRLPVTD